MPRSNSGSSTFRNDRGKRTYIITTRRITSGDELKRRNGLHVETICSTAAVAELLHAARDADAPASITLRSEVTLSRSGIQVPFRVPRVAVDDVRAYMYSLFTQQLALASLGDVQSVLLEALHYAWNGASFTADLIDGVAGRPAGLLEMLGTANGLAPTLTAADKIDGKLAEEFRARKPLYSLVSPSTV